MIKSVLSGSFQFDDAVASIVPLHGRGVVDAAWLHKRAAAQVFDFSKLSSRPGEELVHLLALGDGETIGPNRNGDWFPKAANMKYHPTFMKAHYFHNHDNRDPAKAHGRVVAAAYNEPMGRVELIVGLDSNRCASDLDELEKRGEFPVSMSCRVPYDVCYICGNQARTRKEYCKHAASAMGRIMENGKIACVINDHPDFFDISKVWRGADRVAFTFRKLEKAAADGATLGGAELAELMGIVDVLAPVTRSAYALQKAAVLRQLAEMLDGSALQKMAGVAKLHELDEPVATILKASEDRGALWAALHRAGICLPLNSFMTLAGIEKPADVSDDQIRVGLRDVFANSPRAGCTELVCANGSYDGTTRPITNKVASTIRGIRNNYSLLPEVAHRRTLVKAACEGISEPQLTKSAGAVPPQADVIAGEYAAYVVSFARAATDGRSSGETNFVRNLTALSALA
jgi:hypothetical protein